MNEEAQEFVLQAIAYDNVELLEELLAERPSLANDRDSREGRTPLHHAAAGGHTKCAELLLRSGADVDAVAGLQDTVKTPLGLASSLGHSDVVELLVKSGSDLFYVDSDGHSALQLAQIKGNHDVATLLIGTIERIHVEAEQKNKRLCAACVDGEVAAVLEILSDLGPKTIRKQILNGRSPGEQKSALFLAAEHGRAAIVRALLTVQYHSIIFEPTGDTVLHAAVASQTLLGAEYPDDELKFFEFRRDRENCCFANNGGESACCEGYLFVCNLNAADQEGRTPFFLAVMEGHLEVVQLLAKYKLPISNGTSHRKGMLRVEDSENYLLESPILFDTPQANGKTPLMVACANGTIEIVRILLDQCHVDVNYCHPINGTNGSGALAEAAHNGQLDVLHALFRCWPMAAVHQDSEQHCVNKPRQKKEVEQAKSRGLVQAENVINTCAVPLSEYLPSKGCQLNWQSTCIRELRPEWMVEAVLRLNPQIPRHLGKSLALYAISPHRPVLEPAMLCPPLSFHPSPLSQLVGPFQKWHPSSGNAIRWGGLAIAMPGETLSGRKQAGGTAQTIHNKLRRLPSSVWTANCLRELHLANNLLSELNAAAAAFPQDLRRGSHLYRPAGTGGASAARISRLRQREAADGRAEADENSERQSRSTLKRRDSPSLNQQTSSRRGSAEAVEMSKSRQSTDNEEDLANVAGGGAAAVLEMDIQRVNIWQAKIQLSNIDEDTTTVEAAISGEGGSPEKNGSSIRCLNQLQLLNLAQNKFARMPTCLACCCPRLAKLDLSSNLLTSLGPVGCLPSALRHFDVSKNQLVRLFGGENPAQLRQKLRYCEALPEFVVDAQSDGDGTASGNMPRHSRSRSKSVARSQRSLSVVRKSGDEQLQNEHELLLNSYCCVHKSHCRLEALKTLNLADNSLEFLEVLLPLGGGTATPAATTAADGGNNALLFVGVNEEENEVKQFNWRENSELLKPYVLFPSLTTLDLSQNRIRQLPPTISLLSSLAMLNLANNVELDRLVPELGLLERLWTIGGLGGCQLRGEEPALQTLVQAGNYKTGEVLSQLRQRLENSMLYPKLKLMLLGGPSVGKSTLLQQMRLEGTMAKRSAQNDNWPRRRHSPPPTTASSLGRSNKSRFTSQQRPATATASPSIYPVDVFEWVYEAPKMSSTAKSIPSSQSSATGVDAFRGPVTFRVWDFDGIKQREYQSVQRCFFTRRCLFLLLWKVTDGEIALADLHDFLLAIQAQAPNSYVLIVGTHSDFVREQPLRFPRDYLSQMDKQIQERFILGADPEKNGLPRVLGSLYISCCSREDVKSLCALIYTCATEIRQFSRGGGPARQRLLVQKVPASFVTLERIVVTMTDEFCAAGMEPIMHFNEFWSLATDRLSRLEQQQKQQHNRKVGGTTSAAVVANFRGAQDFRQACLFLHENGVLCYYDDTFLRDFVFLNPPWLCANLYGILTFAALRRGSFSSGTNASPFVTATSLSQMHQNAVIESVELYNALKRALQQHLGLLLSAGISRPSDLSSNFHFRLLRQCVMSLLRKFELALPFQCGRMSLLASCLPDEYVLRADYPGSKVRVRNKFDKLRIRWNGEKETTTAFVPKDNIRSSPVKMSPIRNYLQHRRLSRAVASSIDNLSGGKLADNGMAEDDEKGADLIRVLAVDQCKEECLRRLYMMHYIPPGFWARLSTRLLDDERVGHVLTKLFLLSRAAHVHQQQQLLSMAETDQQQQTNPEAIVATLGRTLNAGRIVNLAQQCTSSFKRGFSVEENVPEEETSFIVVNPAHEVTEEFFFNTAEVSGDEPSSVMVKCCERGVEASDEQCRGLGGGGGKSAAGEDLGNVLEWMLWRSGIEVRCFGTFVLSLRQFLPLASVPDVNYASHELRRRLEDSQWATLSRPTCSDQQNQQVSALSHMIELLIPKIRVRFRWHDVHWELETDSRMATQLLSLITGAVDDLLEDTYPQLGTRFILSPQGRPLVDRLIPCDRCAVEAIREEERYWLRENINRNPAQHGPSNLLPRLAKSASTKFKNNNTPKKSNRVPKSKSSTEKPLHQTFAKLEDNAKTGDNKLRKQSNESGGGNKATASLPIYLFGIEECILEATKLLKNADEQGLIHSHQEQQRLECPRHGTVRWERKDRQKDDPSTTPDLSNMAPDLLFIDLEHEWSVPSAFIQRGKLIGRGAFGFVFTGSLELVPPSSPSALRKRANDDNEQSEATVVALKQFEPVELGNNDADGLAMWDASAQAAVRAFAFKWQNDELEQVSRAYCTARQELCMLSELQHAHCTSMIAFCPSPMALLMELAPHGSLDKLLADYRRYGQKLQLDTIQLSCLQIARALEYLHVQQHIIYRDLKSENVLVWRFPRPANASDRSGAKSLPRDVLLKLGDYGISRFSHPFGMCKGYGGTEGFMAPEIMRYNGEQEYTERADCFSFGMFIYELLTLKQPYEGQPVQQMKERILEAQRPAVSEKELLYATNMLDLMIACWEERAERRPSSSQLVEICSAPEFSHLLDVALLGEGEGEGDDGTSLCLVTSCGGTTTNCANEWSCWLPIVVVGAEGEGDEGGGRQFAQKLPHQRQAQQQLALLKCNQFGWTEKKHVIIIPNPSDGRSTGQQKIRPNISLPKITALAQIYDEFLWVGDEWGTLRIFVLNGQHLMANAPPPLYEIDATKMLEESSSSPSKVHFQEQQSKTEKHKEKDVVHEPLRRSTTTTTTSGSNVSSSASTTAVRHIVGFRERRLVIVGLSVAVLLCRWHGRDSAPELVCCIRLNPISSLGGGGTAAHLYSMALLRSLSDWQLWTGHAAGHIFMHFISSATDRLTFSTSANHYAVAENNDSYQQKRQQQIKKQQKTVPLSRCNVAFLVASNCTKNLAWSAMEGDPRLFMWRDSQLQKTLNSTKILPISESLSSMDNFSVNFQIANEDLGGGTEHQRRWNDSDDDEQLLVGTSNGVVLIVHGIEMSPISAFRPYCSVERLICCPTAGQVSSSRILQKELLSSTKRPSASSLPNEFISQRSVSSSSKKRSLLIEKSRSIMLKATGGSVFGTSEDNCQRPKMSPSTSMPGGQIATDLRNAAVSAVDELCESVRSGVRGIFTSTESAKAAIGPVSNRREAREAYFISIGKGYRPLLSRFVSSAEINALSSKHREENCAIFWRSDQKWAQQNSAVNQH
uniref:Non-specific serine/threonine protein kinase n=1 Tax=Globodera rostochiensis TaxID=31243 RepID=A0A914H1N2_GLORO